jgi:glycerophosphoryl diester phosphodiesterase
MRVFHRLAAIPLAIALLLGNPAVMAAPLIIAHRGASADRPEHTLAAYALAIEQGADFIEPDLVITKDGHLVARHENEISTTTDVASRPEFADRRATRTIDGNAVTGWFTEDFTLAELKTLRARERLPKLRPANTAFDGSETIPTLEEIIALVKAQRRPVGLYPETKHPSYFRGLGLPLEAPLLIVLNRHGYSEAQHPVFIQSFEVGNLQALRPKTRLRLVQLLAGEGGPADRPGTAYAAMRMPEGLKAIAAYADAIGVEKSLVIPRTAEQRLGTPTSLVADAHAAGLKVHVWTFRPENAFLPREYRSSDEPMFKGKAEAEIRTFLNTGIDGLFSDSVTAAVAAVK